MIETENEVKNAPILEKEIKEDRRCLFKWCPDCIWRYNLGTKASTKTEKLKKLQAKGKLFEQVSHPAKSLDIQLLPSQDFVPSKSATVALNSIIVALKDDSVNTIGLYGTGGVGKTRLVKEVVRYAEELGLFDEVVMVVVSQKPDVIKIQNEIAQKLGLRLTEQERAGRLALRLQDEKKKLVILDDVWNDPKLKDIGIIFRDNQKSCKIIVTTRRVHVCKSMKCRPEIQLQVISDEEAMTLLRKVADLHDDSSTWNNVVMDIAKECKGLPVAIVPVGKALRGKTQNEWNVACQQLKDFRLLEIEDLDTEENAYKSLQFSYDYLGSKDTKLCFLLCSLFPEDHEISIEELTRYAIGWGLYSEIASVTEARKRVLVSIETLKNSSLLLDTDSKAFVKMHDVVRDFTLWTASRGENVFIVRDGTGSMEWPATENCTAISIMDSNVRRFPATLAYPRLEIWLFNKPKMSEITKQEAIKVEDASFKGMKRLQVLSLSKVFLSIQSLEVLENLQTLELNNCYINYTTNVSSLFKKLKRLKILSFRYSPIIELSEELGELENLRLLDLRNCKTLRIHSGAIARLSKLEELYISLWTKTSNASPVELNAPCHLTLLCLSLEQVPADLKFPKLSGYSIRLDYTCSYCRFGFEMQDPMPRRLCFEATEANVNSCKNLLENVHHIHLFGNSAVFANLVPNINPKGFNDLISLYVENCVMECLIDTEKQSGFSNLKKLYVRNVRGLKAICKEQLPKGLLQNLEVVNIEDCVDLLEVFRFQVVDTKTDTTNTTRKEDDVRIET